MLVPLPISSCHLDGVKDPERDDCKSGSINQYKPDLQSPLCGSFHASPSDRNLRETTLVLGIETTCDETAASVVENGKNILSNVIFSQADLHKKYGGVFPEIASRLHIDNLIPVIAEALEAAMISPQDLDLIAVAHGPGLIGALLIGLNAAKALSMAWNKPFIGINHVEAHLYAAMMDKDKTLEFPAIGAVVSGGHTLLLKIDGVGQYQPLGTTIDDAIGEAFDKAAAILGLEYPGGPAIEKLAQEGDALAFPFKAGTVKDAPLNFSFSGLKTKVLYTVKGQGSSKHDPIIIAPDDRKHVAASFQRAAFEDVIAKIDLAAKMHGCKTVYLGGGVSNNKTLRLMLQTMAPHLNCYWPLPRLSLDNGAMIAGLAYHKFLKNPVGDRLDLSAQTRMPISCF